MRGAHLPGFVSLPRLFPPTAPSRAVDGRGLRQRRREGARPGIDGEIGLIHAAQLIGARMNMNELLFRAGNIEQRIALCRHLAEARAKHEQEVRVPDALSKGRIDADAGVAHIARAFIVEVILPAERRRDRQARAFGEAAHAQRGLRVPSPSADDRQRTLGRSQRRPELRHLLRRRVGLDAPVRFRVRNGRLFAQHILGQREHDRAGTPRDGGVERPADIFGDARRVVDLRDPLRHLPEHAPEVDLLERLPVHHAAPNLPDEQDHGRGILPGDMDAGAGVRRARRARHHTDAGSAGKLSIGFRHHGRAAFLTAHDERHGVAAIVERVQNSQIALARNAEDHSGSMQMKLIGQNFSPGSQSRLRHSASGAFFRSS